MQMSLMRRISQKIGRAIPAHSVKSKLTAPIASITFDDIPHSAARIGAPILEAANMLGTFYVCGKHTGQTFEGRPQHELHDLIHLHQVGHEIACHSFAHPDVTTLNDPMREQDRDNNQAFLGPHIGDIGLTSFAYPYGAVSLGSKKFYAKHFLTCRGVCAGVNSGTMDFSELLAVGIESRQHDMGRVRSLIDEAMAKNGWLIFFTHDVGPEPSHYGCKPKDLEDVIDALKLANVETMPVKAAAAAAMIG
jgi:peptidoglycan/xylan/chitin deacetylase (PgdA/CDA1 family)